MIVAVPTPLAVTFPLDTVATFVFEEFHITILLVALIGLIDARSVSDFPFVNSNLFLFNDRVITWIVALFTVTMHVSFFPFDVFAVIVAVPAFFAINDPLNTDTIFEFDVVQVTFWLVAFIGFIFAFNVAKEFSVKNSLFLFNDIVLTCIVGFLTVTTQVALRPFDVFAVIVTFPALIHFTNPVFETVAILLFDEDHVIVLSDVFEGDIIAIIFKLFPTSIVQLFGFRVMLFADIPFILNCLEIVPS